VIQRRSTLARLAHRLRRDVRGVTVVEFAMIAPAFLFLILGMMDVGQLVYARSLIIGAAEEAARSNSLETADLAATEQQVGDMLKLIAPGATVDVTYRSYFDFADVGRPEQLNDENGNGLCDDGESYTDENSNGNWDADIGGSTNGSANDVVLYNVTATFDRLFKVPFLPGGSTYTVAASAMRKNQPFANQQGYSATAATC
jgi:Flp pilus assembly protein TadG